MFDCLCDTCKGLFDEEAFADEGAQPFHNVIALQDSAMAGCHLWNMILQNTGPDFLWELECDLDEDWMVPEKQIAASTRLRSDDDQESTPKINEINFFALNQDGSTYSWLSLLLVPMKAFPSIQRNCLRADYTSSGESLDQIKSWFDHCAQSHQDCNRTSDLDSQLPSRLLDLIGIEDFDSNPRLVDGSTLPASTLYTSLSHCWGGNLSIKLESSNLSLYKHEIPFEDLPKTFQDSIWLTRKLGWRYIWIDALCILQDSLVDWEREVIMMDKIYTNSVLTLAATASSDGNGGLFYPKSPLRTTPIIINVESKLYNHGEHLCFVPTEWDRFTNHTPLNKRAWVAQERILSWKTIHFSGDQLRWECVCFTASEALPHGWPTDAMILGHTPNASDNFKRWRIQNQETTHSLIGLWAHTREMFSDKELSYESDKMIAFSGIARQFYSRMELGQDEYLAGLLGLVLERELLWRSLSATTDRKEYPADHDAPSWSWFSVHGPVINLWGSRFDMKDEILWIEVLISIRKAMAHTRSDPYGAVNGGSMHIEGGLFPIILGHDPETDSAITPNNPRFPADNMVVAKWLVNNTGPEKEFVVFWDVREPCFSVSPEHQPVVLGIFYLPVARNTKNGEPVLEGLLLKPTGVKGSFRRVALMELRGRFCFEFLDMARSTHLLGEEFYRESMGNHQYVIELV